MKNVPLRINKELLDDVDTLVEGWAVNRSDFFGAAVNMLVENPQMAEKDHEIFKVDESSLKDALKDSLLFYAVRSLLGGKGLTEATTIIERGSLHIKISKGTLVRYKPPNTIEFEPVGDFRVQLDLVPEINIQLYVSGKKRPLSEEILMHLGNSYGLLFELP